jgi:hypothetical protein
MSLANGILRLAREVAGASWMSDLEKHYGSKARITGKDRKRVEDIVKKSLAAGRDEDGGVDYDKVDEKAMNLVSQMAKSIRSADKAYRRALAAEDENFHDLAEVFYDRAQELWRGMSKAAAWRPRSNVLGRLRNVYSDGGFEFEHPNGRGYYAFSSERWGWSVTLYGGGREIAHLGHRFRTHLEAIEAAEVDAAGDLR